MTPAKLTAPDAPVRTTTPRAATLGPAIGRSLLIAEMMRGGILPPPSATLVEKRRARELRDILM